MTVIPTKKPALYIEQVLCLFKISTVTNRIGLFKIT